MPYRRGLAERARRRLTAALMLASVTMALGILFAPNIWWAFVLLPAGVAVPMLSDWRQVRLGPPDVGEDARVAMLLKALEPEGFTVINGVKTLFGSIDHVLVGPTGIFTIHTVPWRGRVRMARNGRLRRNGRSVDAEVRAAARDAMEIRRTLDRASLRGFVFPVMVLRHARLAQGAVRIDTTTVVETRDLVSIVRSRMQQPLSPDEVNLVAGAILRIQVPVSAPAR